MSRELPILFNTYMVRAILDGRKTVTRRICKDGDDYTVPDMGFYDADKRTYAVHNFSDKEHEDKLSIAERKCPICPGDILYVRETWTYHENAVGGIIYRARCPQLLAEQKKWHPSIHMPKEAARIWLKVTGVRVERLQDIDDDGAKAEGSNWISGKNVGWEEKMQRTAVERFAEIWDKTIKKQDHDTYGWAANPWVWAIEFERCENPDENKCQR